MSHGASLASTRAVSAPLTGSTSSSSCGSISPTLSPAYHVAMPGLVDRDVLVISQKPKLIEMTNEYTISDPDGTSIGTIRQEGQSKAKKFVRLIADVDQFLTHRLVVCEADGTKVMRMVRSRRS